MTEFITRSWHYLAFLAFAVLLTSCWEEGAVTNVNEMEPDAKQKTATAIADNSNTSADSSNIVPGKDYLLLSTPIETEAAGGVEVLEIFWFGCQHCYATQPYVEAWEKSKPANAHLVRMPAPLNGLWSLHAQIFYTNQAMGITEKVHQATFDAIHKKRMRLTSVDDFASYYSKNYGISGEDYVKNFNSFSVYMNLQKAVEKTEQANIRSVPAFIVDGKYLVNTSSAGSTARMFSIINYLIKQES